MAPGEFRLRVRYAKEGRLRFLSHLEVVHALERGARRADLPYAVTHGFNPHMKLAFGPALPVGTEGKSEYFDVWLTQYVPADQALARIAGAMPVGLMPSAAVYVASALPSLSAACTVALYEIRFERGEISEHDLNEALDAVVRMGELTVEHKGKTKVYDLKRSLPKEPRVRSDEKGTVVEMTTRMGQEGSLRPEVLLSEALSRTDTPRAAMTVTRTDTLVEEDGAFARPM